MQYFKNRSTLCHLLFIFRHPAKHKYNWFWGVMRGIWLGVGIILIFPALILFIFLGVQCFISWKVQFFKCFFMRYRKYASEKHIMSVTCPTTDLSFFRLLTPPSLQLYKSLQPSCFCSLQNKIEPNLAKSLGAQDLSANRKCVEICVFCMCF